MRKQILYALAALAGALFFAAPQAARAQSPVAVTGDVEDPIGIPYANSSVSILLVPTGTNPTVGGQAISATNNGLADVNGRFNVSLYKNTDIIPSGSQWQFTICETPGIQPPLGTGGQCFSITVNITAAVDLSTTLDAAAKSLTTITLGAGSVTNVTASAPITSSGGATPNIACPTCNTSSATIAGSIANTQVAFGSAANTIAGSANFTYTLATGVLTSIVTGANPNNLLMSNASTPGYTHGFTTTSSAAPSVGKWSDSLGNFCALSTTGTGSIGCTEATGVAGLTINSSGEQLGIGTTNIFIERTNGTGLQNSGTLTSDLNPFQVQWANNNAGVTFNGVVWNLTDTASVAASKVFQIFGGVAGTTNLFALSKAGGLNLASSLTLGSGASAAGATATGGFACGEATSSGWTPTAGQDYIRCDATHTFLYSLNGASEFPIGLFAATPVGSKCLQSTGILGLIIEAALACNGSLPAHLTYADPTLTVSAATFGNGTLALSGNTSGIATITAPTVAGTSTNPFTLSNILLAPVGAASTPTYSFSAHTNWGWYFDAGNGFMAFSAGGSEDMAFSSSLIFPSTGAVQWTSGSMASANDTGISRDSAGNLDVDTGTVGNKAGIVNAASYKTTTGAVSGVWNCVNVTPVTTSGGSVTTDQNMQACTIPAGTLNLVGKTLKIHTAGVYSTAAASNAAMTIEVKLCTVSGCGSGTVVDICDITSSALGALTISNDNWMLDCTSSTQTAGASAAFERSSLLAIDLVVSNVAPDTIFLDSNATAVTSPTIDSTAQLFLQVSGAFSAASASNVFIGRSLVVESIQ